MHDNHNLIVMTPQYLKHYEEALKKWYPNHEYQPDDTCPQGYAYLFNKEKLFQEYQARVKQ
jgi:hypothetical protein